MQRFTAAEKVALVQQYMGLTHGMKGPWLAERGVASKAMSDWRKAYLFGDLERGLVPRNTAGMSIDDGARTLRLELDLAAEKAARERERRELVAQVAKLEAMNEALGKAIGLLHDHSAARGPIDEN